jgi:ATP-dependent HslUV protease ATP-binding subunit HslU
MRRGFGRIAHQPVRACSTVITGNHKDNILEVALKPLEVIQKLDSYIIGQEDAKRAVAIALRNRWRRHRLPDDLKDEVKPSNILMIGPTGCGKTEIARRIASLSQAPFVKVEATKFTEVGFVGKDIDSIVKDLVEAAIVLVKKMKLEGKKAELAEKVEEKILESLLASESGKDKKSREELQELLRDGKLGDREIDVQVPPGFGQQPMDVPGQGGTINLTEVMGRMGGMGGKGETRKLKMEDARALLEKIEQEEALDMDEVAKEAIKLAEDNGIVFIDEIDKIVTNGAQQGDASSEGVQRDLLPLVEGSSFTTKHGNVDTNHVLFIASGAFHAVKPSDLLAELQGRLPIRVQLKALTEDDLHRILTEPVTNLVRQQVELLATENVTLNITEDATKQLAKSAAEINRLVENIGARRLHAVLERITEDVQFDAPDMEPGATVTIDAEMVKELMSEMLTKTDLSKHIL